MNSYHLAILITHKLENPHGIDCDARISFPFVYLPSSKLLEAVITGKVKPIFFSAGPFESIMDFLRKIQIEKKSYQYSLLKCLKKTLKSQNLLGGKRVVLQ